MFWSFLGSSSLEGILASAQSIGKKMRVTAAKAESFDISPGRR
jgi:hypothetical protein